MIWRCDMSHHTLAIFFVRVFCMCSEISWPFWPPSRDPHVLQPLEDVHVPGLPLAWVNEAAYAVPESYQNQYCISMYFINVACIFPSGMLLMSLIILISGLAFWDILDCFRWSELPSAMAAVQRKSCYGMLCSMAQQLRIAETAGWWTQRYSWLQKRISRLVLGWVEELHHAFGFC